MKLTKAICIGMLFQIFANVALAQQNLVYSNYYLNPFLYNPSYIAPNGYTELFLNYRRQWVGFEGAPVTATANFHFPVNYKMGLGASFIHDQAGVLTTTTGLISFGYQVYLGRDKSIPHKIAFGLSAGLTNSNVSLTDASNPGDPALANNKTSSMDGQFGFHYQNKNFRVGFSIPKLFKSYITSSEDFNTPGLQQITATISTMSYNFVITPRFSFEPTALYRTEKNAPSQWEALGVLSMDRVLWAGGSYRQDYGASVFLGLNVKNSIKVAYAYEFATGQVGKVGNGSHEIQLAIKLGKKKSPPVAKEQKQEEPVLAQQATPEKENKPAEQKDVEVQPNSETIKQQVSNPIIDTKTAVTTQETPSSQNQIVAQTPKQEQSAVETNNNKPKKLTGEALATGHYVVVGAFFSVYNAKNYAATLKKAGYPADVAFHPEKKYYIVHMKNAATLDEAKKLRDIYRAKSRYSFRDTWILSVE
jgi:type IX secretion system PorP/SprF family membrane protein